MRKTAEQLAAAMNEKARLEMTLQKRDTEMEQMQRLIERLEARLRQGQPAAGSRTPNVVGASYLASPRLPISLSLCPSLSMQC